MVSLLHVDGHGGAPDDRNPVEAALRLHSRLLAAIDEAVIATEVDGTINYWNQGAEHLYGWHADEVLGRHVLDVVAVEGAVAQRSEILARLSAGESWSGEFVVHRRDGSTFLAAVKSTPVLDDGGALVGVIGISYDLTERRAFDQFFQRFANFGSWETDLATGTTIWSDGLYRILGLQPGEVEPSLSNALARVHPEDRKAVEGRIHQLRETLEPVESAHRILRPDGEVRWVLDRKEAVVASDGTPLRFWGTDLDITELRRAEEGLEAAEMLFRAGFERSPIGMWLVTTEGRFTTVNPALCEMLGRSESELRALTFADVTHPDDAEEDRAAMARMLSGETETYQTEKRYLRPDGVLVWGLVNASLVRDSDCRPAYFFGQVQDITDRRRVEENARSLAAQQAAVAGLGRSALAGMAHERLMDEAVNVVTSCLGLECAAVLRLRSTGDLLVKAVVGCPTTVVGSRLTIEDDTQAAYTLDAGEAVVVTDLRTETRFAPPRQFFEHGLVSGLSAVITVHNRSYGVLSAYSTEARQFSSEDVNFVQAIANVVGTAVARRRHEEAEERAHQQERLAAVGQLAAGMAHDFNNIVSAIGLYSELLAAGQDLNDASSAHLGAIRQQVERGTSLVWQVLDFAHRSPIEWVEVDLVTFLDGLLTLIRRTLPDGVVVTVHHDAGPYVVRGDPTRLQQIVMNLVTNAKDALEGSGELRIMLSHGAPTGEAGVPPDLTEGDAWVCIEVVDNGRGMPPDVLGRVFEPFFTTKARGHGTGLGLAQVHGLVSQHGGHIDIDSSVGTGTTVGIWLRAVDHSARAEPEQRPQVSRGAGEGVLVVDDDAALRTALGQIL